MTKKFTVIPSHDERVIVDITIPRPGRTKNLKFKAARIDFQPVELVAQYTADYLKLQEWIEAESKKATGADVDVPERPTIHGHEFDHPLGWWAYALEMPDADELVKMPAGERDQVWKIWQDAAEVELGESSASGEA